MPWSDSENLLAGFGGGSLDLQGPWGHLNFDYGEGGDGVEESGIWSHGPVETSSAGLRDMCFSSPILEDTLSWMWPEVRTGFHGFHEGDDVAPTAGTAGPSAVEVGTSQVGKDPENIEDGWWPSFPISAFLVDRTQTSRSPWKLSLGSSSNEPYREFDVSSGASSLPVRPHPVVSYAVSVAQTENTSSSSQGNGFRASNGGDEGRFMLSPPQK